MSDETTEHITAREFDERMRALTNAVVDGLSGMSQRLDEGMSGVHHRLDRVNGRLDKHDSRLNVLQPRVAAHDVMIVGHDREFKDVKASLRGNVTAVADGTTKAKSDDPATVSLSISPKMWALMAAVASASSLFMPPLVKWFEKWLGMP